MTGRNGDEHGDDRAAELEHELEDLHHELHVPPEGHPHRKLKSWQLGLLIGPIIAMVICTNIANAFFPTLAVDNPLLLIALSSVNRNLIIASQQVGVVAYYLVGFLRLVAPDAFFYALGFLYGERALSWMERRTPTIGRLLRTLERWFAKGLGYPLVLIMPNNYVCLVAGAASMRLRWFISLNIIGTIGRLVLMAWIGETFDGAVSAVLGFLRSYRWPLLALTVGIVAITMWREARLGNTQVQQLLELEDELERAEDEARP